MLSKTRCCRCTASTPTTSPLASTIDPNWGMSHYLDKWAVLLTGWQHCSRKERSTTSGSIACGGLPKLRDFGPLPRSHEIDRPGTLVLLGIKTLLQVSEKQARVDPVVGGRQDGFHAIG